jgi:hypothetical protein
MGLRVPGRSRHAQRTAALPDADARDRRQHRRAARGFGRKGISEEEFRAKLMQQVDKKLTIAKKFSEKVTP